MHISKLGRGYGKGFLNQLNNKLVNINVNERKHLRNIIPQYLYT